MKDLQLHSLTEVDSVKISFREGQGWYVGVFTEIKAKAHVATYVVSSSSGSIVRSIIHSTASNISCIVYIGAAALAFPIGYPRVTTHYFAISIDVYTYSTQKNFLAHPDFI
ncbi:hypothetical protein MKS88_000452 [Plasmodium brasilianum]|uniref:Uncharacterized protein n=2 Tax=Plasmodium (Plasmodium) TaxID=418103 RepID=A0A1A8WXP2_PLAMA|nr:hypothetical protein MKS88_000452 [Plasmodium brasilianum]SBS96653.1 hypothetical protein PMALA_055770 [Plasmodium malariae]